MLAGLLLLWMWRRVRKVGGFGPNGSAWLRSLAPLLLGLGAWFATLLVVMPLWPATPLDSTIVAVISMGLAIGAGLYLAWVDRRMEANTRYLGLAVAVIGALIGAWLGFSAVAGLVAVITTIIGAAIVGNLALIAHDITIDKRSGRSLLIDLTNDETKEGEQPQPLPAEPEFQPTPHD